MHHGQFCCRIVFAMQQYKSEGGWDITRWERNYSQLSEQHKYVDVSATDMTWIAR